MIEYLKPAAEYLAAITPETFQKCVELQVTVGHSMIAGGLFCAGIAIAVSITIVVLACRKADEAIHGLWLLVLIAAILGGGLLHDGHIKVENPVLCAATSIVRDLYR